MAVVVIVRFANFLWLLGFAFQLWILEKERSTESTSFSFIWKFGTLVVTGKISWTDLYRNIQVILLLIFFLILNDIFFDRNFPHLLYVGYYKIRQPAIIIRDPELARTILIKEFNSFHDNDIELDEKFDPIGGKNPFVAKGNRWKISKSQLTPCFTSKKVKSLLYYFL